MSSICYVKIKLILFTGGFGLLQDPLGRPLFFTSPVSGVVADLGVVVIPMFCGVISIFGRYVDMSGVPKYISLGIFVSSSELDEEDSEALKLK